MKRLAMFLFLMLPFFIGCQKNSHINDSGLVEKIDFAFIHMDGHVKLSINDNVFLDKPLHADEPSNGLSELIKLDVPIGKVQVKLEHNHNVLF